MYLFDMLRAARCRQRKRAGMNCPHCGGPRRQGKHPCPWCQRPITTTKAAQSFKAWSEPGKRVTITPSDYDNDPNNKVSGPETAAKGYL